MNIKTILTIILIALPVQSYAQGIPVYDATSFAQFSTTINEMAKDYQKQIEQLEAMSGARNAGMLSNGAFEQQLKQYLPNTWEDTMDMINAGTLPSGAYATQGIFSDLYNEYNPITGEQTYITDPSGYNAKALDRITGTTMAAMAASEQIFNQTEQRNQIYQNLLSELNNSPDMKNSVDLQARIMAENGMAINELMRQNAIQMQQKAANDNKDLMNIKRAAEQNKYDATKAREAMELTP